jgi:hypothetical protein
MQERGWRDRRKGQQSELRPSGWTQARKGHAPLSRSGRRRDDNYDDHPANDHHNYGATAPAPNNHDNGVRAATATYYGSSGKLSPVERRGQLL